MLRFKPEVRIGFLGEPLTDPLAAACRWSARTRIDVEVNSIEDGPQMHSIGSLHAYGLAIDFDTVGDRTADLEQLAEWFRRTLPATYDVVFEGDHVHVEYDTRRPPLRRAVP